MRSTCVQSLGVGLLLLGATAISLQAAITPTEILSYTNVWKYNQDAVQLPTTWKNPGFNDSAWPSGMGVLGYPQGEDLGVAGNPVPWINTILDRFVGGGGGGTQILTYYFRTTVNFPFSPATPGLVIRASALIDDGAIVYLNGKEIARIAMPGGTPTYNTLASRQNDISQHGVDEFTIKASDFVQGANTLAVEVHQGGATSSDAIMGLKIVVSQLDPIRIIKQPESQVVPVGSSVEFSVTVVGSDPVYRWFRNGVMIGTQPTYTIPRAFTTHSGTFWVVVSNALGAVESDHVTLKVIEDLFGPRITSVTVTTNIVSGNETNTQIIVRFDESTDRTSATNKANYLIYDQRRPTTTFPLSDRVPVAWSGSLVRLTTATPLFSSNRYVLRVSGVTDRRKNAIAPGSEIGIGFVVSTNIFQMGQSWRFAFNDPFLPPVPSTWKLPSFDDSQWALQPGIFFYENTPPPLCEGQYNTTLDFFDTLVTYYFRTRFTAPPNSGQASLVLRHFIDDGAVFYLNGQEIGRYNMPTGAVGDNTLASGSIEASCQTQSFEVSNLRTGDNVLAVEVHKARTGTGDLDVEFGARLDLSFNIVPGLRPPRRPTLNMTYDGTNIVFSWSGNGFALETTDDLINGTWFEVQPNMSNPMTVTPSETRQFFRLRFKK